ncbi:MULTISPECIES: hypothetical protein [Streptomyces]|uniref:hypothetical protein n=1 Tax=Streptomyces TaxID=1883 RepID=UPI00342C4F5B
MSALFLVEFVIGAFGAQQAPIGRGHYGDGPGRESEVCERRPQVVTRALAEDRAG